MHGMPLPSSSNPAWRDVNRTRTTAGNVHTSRLYLLARALETMLDDERLGAEEIATYVAIQRHSDASAHCHPAQGSLAHKLGKSRTWVNARVKRLVECDYLEATHRFQAKGGQTSNAYYLPHLDTDVIMVSVARADRRPQDDSPCLDDDTPCHEADTNRTDSDLEKNPSLSGAERAVFEKPCKGRKQTSAAQQDHPIPSAPQQQPGQHPARINAALDCRLIPEDWQPSPDDLTWATQTRPDIEDLQRFTTKFVAKINATGGTTGPIWAKWRHWLATETTPRRQQVPSLVRSGAQKRARPMAKPPVSESRDTVTAGNLAIFLQTQTLLSGETDLRSSAIEIVVEQCHGR